MGAPRFFLLALSFCTGLAPARMACGRDLGASMFWFPAVGGVLGLALAMPHWLGVLPESSWIAAWLLLALNVYLTRGLHWDGLADVIDGWGSNAHGEKFWQVLKDSRAGVFAVIGLVVGLLGQAVLFREMLHHNAPLALVWCPVLGRCAVPVLALLCREMGRPGMGRDFLAAARPSMLAPVLLACGIGALLLVSWKAVIVGVLLLGICIWRLHGLAQRQCGCNGDFLGAAIICGELAAGLGWALTR